MSATVLDRPIVINRGKNRFIAPLGLVISVVIANFGGGVIGLLYSALPDATVYGTALVGASGAVLLLIIATVITFKFDDITINRVVLSELNVIYRLASLGEQARTFRAVNSEGQSIRGMLVPIDGTQRSKEFGEYYVIEFS